MRGCICTESPVFPGSVCFLVGGRLWWEEAERPWRELGEGARLPPLSPLPPLTDHLSLLPAAPPSPRTFSLLLTWTFPWPSSLHPSLALLGQGLFKDPLKSEPLFWPRGPFLPTPYVCEPAFDWHGHQVDVSLPQQTVNSEDKCKLVLLTTVCPPSGSGSAGERVPDTLQVGGGRGGGRRKERREGVLQGIGESGEQKRGRDGTSYYQEQCRLSPTLPENVLPFPCSNQSRASQVVLVVKNPPANPG